MQCLHQDYPWIDSFVRSGEKVSFKFLSNRYSQWLDLDALNRRESVSR